MAMIQWWSKQRIVKPLISIAIAISLWGCAERDTRDLENYVNRIKAESPGKPLEPLPETEPYVPFEYRAQDLKDPFATSEWVKAAEIRQLEEVLDNGISPDLDRPREELERYQLGALKMVGTFRNTQTEDNTLWALVRAPDGIVHRVREGNFMGTNHGQIANITEERIDLNEIIRDEATSAWRERDNYLTLAD